MTWVVIHFGLLNWLGDAHHPWRPIVEGVSWVAGIGALTVAVLALPVPLLRTQGEPDSAQPGSWARFKGAKSPHGQRHQLWRLETTGEKNEVLLVSVANGLVLDATFEVSGDSHPVLSENTGEQQMDGAAAPRSHGGGPLSPQWLTPVPVDTAAHGHRSAARV